MDERAVAESLHVCAILIVACLPSHRLAKAEAETLKLSSVHADRISELMQGKMDSAIEAAGYKAEAAQLREQLVQQSRQIESWVNCAFLSRKHHALYECCDMSGSLID